MLSVYDKDFKLLYREFPSFYNEVFHLNNGMHPLRSFGNDIYLKEPWTHNIYKIEKMCIRDRVTGVYAAEAISDATAAICCTLLFFWQFPKILGKIQGNTLRTS